MPFKRMTDWIGLITWGATVIFFGGVFYHSDVNQQEAIAKLEVASHRHINDSTQLTTRVNTLEINQANQIIWQNNMLATLKDMYGEVKINNERGIRIEANVKNIEEKLK